jgi:hypothetical protein
MAAPVVDSHLSCRKCKSHVYTLWRVPVPNQVGVFTHRLWPSQGTVTGPPTDPTHMTCPICTTSLVRTSPNLDPTKESF